MNYPLINNVWYVYKESFKKYPRIKLYLIVNLITELLVPLMSILITTILVFSLTNNVQKEQYIFMIVGFVVFTYILESLRAWSNTRYNSENTFTRLTAFNVGLAEHQLKTNYMNVESKERRDIISKAYEAIMSNFYGIEMMLKQTPLLVINIVGILVFGVLIAMYVPIVLLVLIVMTLVNFFLTKRANKHLREMSNQLNNEFREKYYLAKDSTNPNYGKDIRIYNIGKWFDQIFIKLTRSRRKITSGVERKFLFANTSNTLFLFIRDFIAYGLLLRLVMSNSITLATFTFLIGIVIGFSAWLNGFTRSFNELRTSSISVGHYRDCVSSDTEYQHSHLYTSDELIRPLTIEFENVTFYYPNTTTPVIENLSFKIKGNERVALVGNNGAGKTTIVKLLCGLYRPNSGVIRVAGYDISKLNIADYQTLLSVVFQDSTPFSFTIESNITCQSELDVDSAKLRYALRQSGLSTKINSLPEKEKTYITQIFNKNGIRLSGGETQKMMLARSLYKNAPLLILDEPTAALDPIAEEEMYLQYKELIKDSTSIFISHRLSSTKFCDRIFLLDNGNIIEEGTHDDLIKLDKNYKEMFEIQAQYYREVDNNEGI